MGISTSPILPAIVGVAGAVVVDQYVPKSKRVLGLLGVATATVGVYWLQNRQVAAEQGVGQPRPLTPGVLYDTRDYYPPVEPATATAGIGSGRRGRWRV